MDTENLDVVYVVKDSPQNEELRYSMRSLKNLKGIGKIWIFGGCPDWVNLEKVNYIKVNQDQGNKWDNTAGNLLAICMHEGVSENFILMNDDFFVMKKTDKIDYYYDRSLASRRSDFFKKMGTLFYMRNRYTRRLLEAEQALLQKGHSTKNYELHLPMIFNKNRLESVITDYQNIGAKRSLYGNIYVQDAIQTSDVKIWETFVEADKKAQFLSTSDRAFADGKVGAYIRNKFKTKSIYEKEEDGR